MRPHCYFAFTLLCSLSLLSPVLSIQCDDTQYEWPVQKPEYCCNKCRPGEYMVGRSDQCKIQCKPCPEDMYKDVFTVALSCKFCVSCNGDNMEYESPCNATHNTVCRCKAGYECKDESCKDCVPTATIAPSTVSMESVRSHTHKVTRVATSVLGDTVWFLVVIALLAAVIAVIVLTKIKPFLRWIRSKHGYIFSEACAEVPTSEDTEVSQPVQDTCGKCYQPIV